MHQVPSTTRAGPSPSEVGRIDNDNLSPCCTRASTYEIPDIAIQDPHNRKIKVLTIGAGVSGIMMAYKLQKECRNVEHVVYEKDADIGGVWLQNRSVGESSDPGNLTLTYSFALNPNWPQFFSQTDHKRKANDIWQYLDTVCTTFGLREYMTFNTTVTRCEWQSATHHWKVQLSQQLPDGTTREFEESCDVLLHATGLLHEFKWPDIKGLGKFAGKLIHTADWPKDYSAEHWKNEMVAVIGSGASSIQTVPNMQPHVKHMDVFVRTGVWFVAIARNFGQNHRYSEENKALFRDDPDELVSHAKDIEEQVNEAFNGFFRDTVAQRRDRAKWSARMADLIQDERLRAGFTPSWGVGCQRVTPGDPYMKAIQQANVDVHFTGVNGLTEDGVVGDDGIERKVDTVICATVFPIVGENGTNLAMKWKTASESYFGLTVPEIQNLVLFFGPTWPIANGSAMGPLNAVGDYAVQTIKKLQQTPNLLSFAPRQDLTDAFNEHVQEWIKHTVWSEGCRSWYKNNETGRVNAVWPGSSLHYIKAIDVVRWEDYHLRYRQTTDEGKRDNPFSWAGMGRAVENHAENMDRSPYINRDAIDDRWLKAMQQKHC